MKKILCLVAVLGVILSTGCPLVTVHRKAVAIAGKVETAYSIFKMEYLDWAAIYDAQRTSIAGKCGAGEIPAGVCERLAKADEKFKALDLEAQAVGARAQTIGEAKDALIQIIEDQVAVLEASREP